MDCAGLGNFQAARYAETTGFFTGSTLQDTTDALTYTTYGELDTFAGRKGGSTLYSFDLGRDAGGRITQKSETIEGTTSLWEYRYDTAGRLDEVKKDGAVVATYGYDSNSNRISWTDFWGSGSATYDVQDRLLTSGPRSYTYTANGELLTKTNGTDVTTYGYDVFGNLRTVELPTGVEIEYLIDAANRRIGKRVNDTLVSGFLWQSQLQPAAELDGSGAIVSEFVYGTKGNVPDYVVKGETTYRIFTDHLGSVRLVLDAATGAVAQRIDYDAFGRILLDTNPGFQPFGFAGGLYDPQTGLTRFGARDYDPETGRWTSKDPIGFAGGDTNLFGYVASSPTNGVDPSGEYRQEVHYGRTYVWGLQEGLSESQATMVAKYNQGLDEGLTNPLFGLYSWRHFRPRGEVISDIYSAIQRADLAAFGAHLHELQDTFSHQGHYPWWKGGHALKKEYFDHWFWPLDFMARSTWTDTFDPCSGRDKAMERMTRLMFKMLIKRLRQNA